MERQPSVEEVNHAIDVLFAALGAEAFDELPFTELTRLAGAIIAAEIETGMILLDDGYQSTSTVVEIRQRTDRSVAA